MSRPATPAPIAAPCPCDESRPYAQCCGRWHAGDAAPDAAALMRSRYSAYVRRLEPYLLATWHRSTRPATLDLATGQAAPTWLGLRLLRHASEADAATVEFVARYRVGGGSAVRLHEVSRFRREDGRWFYVDGEIRAE